MTTNPLKLLLLIGAVALTLMGCAPNVGGFAVLDRAEQSSDALPENLQDFNISDTADLSTARYIGEHHGSQVWLTRDKGETGVCLLAYAEAALTASSCVTPEAPMTVGTPGIDFYVVPDGKPGPKNAAKISENLYAKG